MDDKQLLAIVDDEFTSAMGAPQGDISTERAKAWDYYMSKPLGNEVEGQSEVVASVVSDVVDGIMPSLMRIFTTADNLVSFDPVSSEDVPQARQESDYVTHVVFKQNDCFETLYTWFFDALVQKNGIVKAWWDESEEVTTETYSGLSLYELTDLLDDPELEPVARSEREPNGDEVAGPDGLVHDVEFRRVRKTGKACFDNVPPEEYRISADARKLDPSRARMVGQEREIPRSDLIEMGFSRDVVDALPKYIRDGRGPQGGNEELARYDRQDERDDSAREKSMDLIQVREAYMRVDFDGDGIAELRKITVAGGKVIENAPVDRQPFHVISPQPLPHKHFGRASSEKVMDLHEIVTTLWRQSLDNLYHTNNPSHAVWEMGMGENTLDDLMTTRVGSIKRFARPVQESYQQISVPFTASATFPMMDLLEKVKRDRTGVSSDGQALSPDALKNIQQSVMAQATDQALAKIELIVRVFAETGLRSLFQHMRELLSKHSAKAAVVRLRNEWVEVDPRHWRDRQDVSVHIGVGLGTRDTRRATLLAVQQVQEKMIQAGGMNLTVTPKNVYNTAAELVKNENIGDPSLHFTDPGDKPSPPPSSEQEQLQAQQQQLMERQQQLDAQDMQIKQAKLDLDRQRALFEDERKGSEFKHKREHDNAKLMLESQKVAQDIRSARTADEMKAAQVRMDNLLKAAQAEKVGAETQDLRAEDSPAE